MRDWREFEGLVFDQYLPNIGEGETMATQIATAVCKLVYKWFNDGDVYDNVTSPMQGWYNDLSSYANWLAKYVSGAKMILDMVFDCFGEDEYTEILYDLCMSIGADDMAEFNKVEKVGSVYDCDGDYQFSDWDDEEEEYY